MFALDGKIYIGNKRYLCLGALSSLRQEIGKPPLIIPIKPVENYCPRLSQQRTFSCSSTLKSSLDILMVLFFNLTFPHCAGENRPDLHTRHSLPYMELFQYHFLNSLGTTPLLLCLALRNGGKQGKT